MGLRENVKVMAHIYRKAGVLLFEVYCENSLMPKWLSSLLYVCKAHAFLRDKHNVVHSHTFSILRMKLYTTIYAENMDARR